MLAVSAPSPSPPASQTQTAFLSQPIASTSPTTNDEEQGVSLSRNTSVISTNSSSSSSSSLEPPPRPRPIRTYTGPQAKNVPDVLPASPTTPKATQRNFDDYMMGATMGVGGVVGGAVGGPRRAGTPPGAGGGNIAAQMAQAIAYSGTGLMVPGALLNGGSTSGSATPIRGSPTPGTSTPNGARSRQASSSNTPSNYQFQDFLGEGSYSSVYTAVSLVNQQVYAIKVIQKRLLQKENKVRYATSERAILSKLGAAGHPGIIKLYSAFQDQNSLYFAFELAPNGDLFKQIRQLGSFDIIGTRYYAAMILDAVTFIHSMNIIHRDLKPENILLDASMRPKISDFGSAKDKSIAVITTGDAKSLKGSFVGTPEYASPEMLVPPTITTRASDIWAFGCVAYQFIAGRPPFKESTDYLTMKKIQEGSYSFPEGFDEVVKTLVEGCLVTNPVNRTTSGDLRKHAFFADIDWDTLWTLPPPELKSGLVAAPERRDDEFKLHWSDLEGSEDEMDDYIPKPRSDQSSLKLQMPSVDQNPARQSTPPPSQAVEPRGSIDETPTRSRDVKNMVYPAPLTESHWKQRRYSQPTESTKRKVSPVSERTTRQGSPEDLVSKLRRFSSSSDSHARPRRQSPSTDLRPSVNGPLEEDDDSEIGSGEGPPSTLDHNIRELVSQTPAETTPHARDPESSTGLKSELTQESLASTRLSASETSATSKTPEDSPTSGPKSGFEKVRGAKGLELVDQMSSGEKPWVLANGTKVLAETESELYSSPVTHRIKRNLLPPKQRRRVLLLTSSGRLLCLKELKSTTGRKKVQVEDEIMMRGSSSPKVATTESQSETTAASVPAAHSSAPEIMSMPSSSSPSKRSSLLGLSLSGGSSITSTLPNLLLNLPGSSRNHTPATSILNSQNGSATPSGSPSRLASVATKVEIIGDAAVTVHTSTSICTYMADSPMIAKCWVEKLQEAMKQL